MSTMLLHIELHVVLLINQAKEPRNKENPLKKKVCSINTAWFENRKIQVMLYWENDFI